ncbi:MAG: FliH/SctL family protein [Planctomycetota bacterium]
MALIRQAEWSQGGKEAVVHNLSDLKRQAEHAHTLAQEHAAGIVEHAMRERTRLMGDASEAGHAQGYAAGFEAGRLAGAQQGRTDAYEQMSPALQDVQTQWLAALDEFNARRDEMLAQSRRDVLSLALAIAQRVVKRKIAADPGVVVDQVQAVLEKLSRPTRLTVVINPADQESVRQALPALASRLIGGVHAELATDDAIARGSCVARSAGGEIDASIDTQLDRIAQALVPGTPAVVAKVDPAGDTQSSMERAA